MKKIGYIILIFIVLGLNLTGAENSKEVKNLKILEVNLNSKGYIKLKDRLNGIKELEDVLNKSDKEMYLKYKLFEGLLTNNIEELSLSVVVNSKINILGRIQVAPNSKELIDAYINNYFDKKEGYYKIKKEYRKFLAEMYLIDLYIKYENEKTLIFFENPDILKNNLISKNIKNENISKNNILYLNMLLGKIFKMTSLENKNIKLGNKDLKNNDLKDKELEINIFYDKELDKFMPRLSIFQRIEDSLNKYELLGIDFRLDNKILNKTIANIANMFSQEKITKIGIFREMKKQIKTVNLKSGGYQTKERDFTKLVSGGEIGLEKNKKIVNISPLDKKYYPYISYDGKNWGEINKIKNQNYLYLKTSEDKKVQKMIYTVLEGGYNLEIIPLEKEEKNIN